jgi:hypothetical protein
MAKYRIVKVDGHYETQFFIGIGSLGFWNTHGQGGSTHGFNPNKYSSIEDAEKALCKRGCVKQVVKYINS